MSLFTLHTRSRIATGPNLGSVVEAIVQWEARETAVIVCDMWDRHWCSDAAKRVDEMAPVMDRVLTAARGKGILIVHAPSDTMEYYRDFPQRLRALHAPQAAATVLKTRPIEPPLPIDDSDQGCSSPETEAHWVWTSQHPAITIASEDAMSDDGDEIANLFAQNGIQNVIMMGVHTNMCVLCRSFGLRRQVERGKNVVLVRDLTDSMYNPARAPFVSHDEGTALVIAHIETYICPSVSSTDLTA